MDLIRLLSLPPIARALYARLKFTPAAVQNAASARFAAAPCVNPSISPALLAVLRVPAQTAPSQNARRVSHRRESPKLIVLFPRLRRNTTRATKGSNETAILRWKL